MIKVIAFDLVGVIVSEKDIYLTEEESKLERMFGPNKSDSDYLQEARKIVKKDSIIIRITKDIIDRLYHNKQENLFKNIKIKFPKVKIIIATNHVSYVKDFINKNFDIEYLDDIIISAEINEIKPDKEFYEYILDKFSLLPNELLFLDDNTDNVEGAKKLGINTIKVNKDMDIYDEIVRQKNLTNIKNNDIF